MEKTKNFIKKNWKQIILFFTISLVIVCLAFYFFNLFNFLFSNSQTSECHEIYGSFGSYVGGILGTIIGFITLILVYKTYTSQKKELKLQRELIAQQQFESTFFNMLNVHRELKNNLEVNIINRICNITIEKESLKPSSNGPFYRPTTKDEIDDFYGINVFKLIKLDFDFLYKSFKSLNTTLGSQNFSNKIINDEIKNLLIKERHLISIDNKNEEVIINVIFKLVYTRYKNIIGHYCRNIYHILKFIRESETQNNKNYRKYADIFQSQLNEDEQFILFYNYIAFQTNVEVEEILYPINIVNHYKFLENLGSNNLLDKELHNNKKFYTFDIK